MGRSCADKSEIACGRFSNPGLDKDMVVNIDLLQASSAGDVAKIRAAVDAGANLETRRPLVIRLQKDPDDSDEDDEGKKGDGKDEEVLDFQGQNDIGKARSSKNKVRARGMTSLMKAAAEGRLEAVKVLLQLNANPLSKDEDGMHSLHFAASAGCRECCQLLLGAKCSPATRDDNDRVPLDCISDDRLIDRQERHSWEALLFPMRNGTEDKGTEVSAKEKEKANSKERQTRLAKPSGGDVRGTSS